VTYRGLRTVALDGCNSLRVPDTVCNRSWLGSNPQISLILLEILLSNTSSNSMEACNSGITIWLSALSAPL
jgi:hypothetical protein